MASLDEFMLGEWDYDFDSSWVDGIAYHLDERKLDVQFRDGTICRYSVGPSVAKEMYEAPSKGQFVHAELYHRSYEIL
jgi:hypothetical protein